MPLPLTVSCFSKSRLVLPFWYRLNRVVLDKGPLNVCVCVCVECHCSMKYHTQWSNKSNKSVFRLFHHLWMWHCPHLLLSTGACCTAPATCPLLSTYISCPQGAQQKTRRPLLLLVIDGTDRRTDRCSTTTQTLLCIQRGHHQQYRTLHKMCTGAFSKPFCNPGTNL